MSWVKEGHLKAPNETVCRETLLQLVQPAFDVPSSVCSGQALARR